MGGGNLVASGHLDEVGMDRYALGCMADEENAVVEEHLLICTGCQQRLAENDVFVKAMRAASAEYVRKRSNRRSGGKRRGSTVAALAAGLLLSVGAAGWQLAQRAGPPAIVKLEAYRGAARGTQAPAGRKLVLRFDMSGLPDLPSYELEIVDRWGNPVTRAKAQPGLAPVPALRAGTYFVRIYAAGGQLLREYGLEVSEGSH
jgi:hypothetical protein